MSVLWRAAVTRHPMFGRVKLGPVAERLKMMLLARDPGRSSEYSVALGVFSEQGKIPSLGIGVMDPFLERFDSIRVCRFYFGRVTALIKTDSRPFAPPLSEIALDAGKPMVLVNRDLRSSPELRAVGRVLNASQNSRAFAPPKDQVANS
jgi:hypothetical protein